MLRVLEVEFVDLVKRVAEGGSDEEILEWCFVHGHRPNAIQKRIWNAFAEKFGWRDRAAGFLQSIKREDGVEHLNEIETTFDSIDHREGRVPL